MSHLMYTHTHAGYSLIEVLVAVALLMFAIVGPMTIAVKSSQSALYARQQNTAFFLAQEGASIINTIRNDAALATVRAGAGNPWTWTNTASLAACKASYGCNIDMQDATPLTHVTSCENKQNCTLSYTDTNARVRYRVGSGAPTPYTRVITLSTLGADEIQVRSAVSWNSGLLGSTQEVSVTTSLFNIFK